MGVREMEAIYEAIDRGDQDGAREALRVVKERGLGTPSQRAMLEAAVLASEGNVEEALDLLGRFEDEHGLDTGVALQMAELYRVAGDPDGAMSVLEDLETPPSELPPSVALTKAELLIELRRWSEALPLLELVAGEPDLRMDHLVAKAEALGELGRFDEALKDIEEVLRESEDEARAWFIRALVQQQTGDLAEADRCFERARECGAEEAPPYRVKPADFKRLVTQAIRKLPAGLQDIAKRTPIEHWETGRHTVEVWEEEQIEHGALGGASVLGSVSDPALQCGRRPEKIILVQRALESDAGDRKGLVERVRESLETLLLPFRPAEALAMPDVGPTRDRAGADRNHQLGSRHSRIRLEQRQPHVGRHGAGHDQPVCMARRGHELKAEPAQIEHHRG